MLSVKIDIEPEHIRPWALDMPLLIPTVPDLSSYTVQFMQNIQRDTESMEKSMIHTAGITSYYRHEPVLTFHGERFCIFPNFVKGAFKRRVAVLPLTKFGKMPVSHHGK